MGFLKRKSSSKDKEKKSTKQDGGETNQSSTSSTAQSKSNPIESMKRKLSFRRRKNTEETLNISDAELVFSTYSGPSIDHIEGTLKKRTKSAPPPQMAFYEQPKTTPEPSPQLTTAPVLMGENEPIRDEDIHELEDLLKDFSESSNNLSNEPAKERYQTTTTKSPQSPSKSKTNTSPSNSLKTPPATPKGILDNIPAWQRNLVLDDGRGIHQISNVRKSEVLEDARLLDKLLAMEKEDERDEVFDDDTTDINNNKTNEFLDEHASIKKMVTTISSQQSTEDFQQRQQQPTLAKQQVEDETIVQIHREDAKPTKLFEDIENILEVESSSKKSSRQQVDDEDELIVAEEKQDVEACVEFSDEFFAQLDEQEDNDTEADQIRPAVATKENKSTVIEEENQILYKLIAPSHSQLNEESTIIKISSIDKESSPSNNVPKKQVVSIRLGAGSTSSKPAKVSVRINSSLSSKSNSVEEPDRKPQQKADFKETDIDNAEDFKETDIDNTETIEKTDIHNEKNIEETDIDNEENIEQCLNQEMSKKDYITGTNGSSNIENFASEKSDNVIHDAMDDLSGITKTVPFNSKQQQEYMTPVDDCKIITSSERNLESQNYAFPLDEKKEEYKKKLENEIELTNKLTAKPNVKITERITIKLTEDEVQISSTLDEIRYDSACAEINPRVGDEVEDREARIERLLQIGSSSKGKESVAPKELGKGDIENLPEEPIDSEPSQEGKEDKKRKIKEDELIQFSINTVQEAPEDTPNNSQEDVNESPQIKMITPDTLSILEETVGDTEDLEPEDKEKLMDESCIAITEDTQETLPIDIHQELEVPEVSLTSDIVREPAKQVPESLAGDCSQETKDETVPSQSSPDSIIQQAADEEIPESSRTNHPQMGHGTRREELIKDLLTKMSHLDEKQHVPLTLLRDEDRIRITYSPSFDADHGEAEEEEKSEDGCSSERGAIENKSSENEVKAEGDYKQISDSVDGFQEDESKVTKLAFALMTKYRQAEENCEIHGGLFEEVEDVYDEEELSNEEKKLTRNHFFDKDNEDGVPLGLFGDFSQNTKPVQQEGRSYLGSPDTSSSKPSSPKEAEVQPQDLQVEHDQNIESGLTEIPQKPTEYHVQTYECTETAVQQPREAHGSVNIQTTKKFTAKSISISSQNASPILYDFDETIDLTDEAIQQTTPVEESVRIEPNFVFVNKTRQATTVEESITCDSVADEKLKLDFQSMTDANQVEDIPPILDMVEEQIDCVVVSDQQMTPDEVISDENSMTQISSNREKIPSDDQKNFDKLIISDIPQITDLDQMTPDDIIPEEECFILLDTINEETPPTTTTATVATFAEILEDSQIKLLEQCVESELHVLETRGVSTGENYESACHDINPRLEREVIEREQRIKDLLNRGRRSESNEEEEEIEASGSQNVYSEAPTNSFEDENNNRKVTLTVFQKNECDDSKTYPIPHNTYTKGSIMETEPPIHRTDEIVVPSATSEKKPLFQSEAVTLEIRGDRLIEKDDSQKYLDQNRNHQIPVKLSSVKNRRPHNITLELRSSGPLVGSKAPILTHSIEVNNTSAEVNNNTIELKNTFNGGEVTLLIDQNDHDENGISSVRRIPTTSL